MVLDRRTRSDNRSCKMNRYQRVTSARDWAIAVSQLTILYDNANFIIERSLLQ